MRLLFLFCAFLPVFVNAQISISGRVVDSKSGDPVPYATLISIVDNSGTVTNPEGGFTLHLSDANKPIQISCLGYNSVEKTISDGEIITLTPAVTEIETVVVTPVDIAAILKNIQKNYYTNTSSEPTELYANIRQYQIFDGDYIQAIDMIGNIVMPANKSLGKTSKYKVTAVNASLYKDDTRDNFEYSIKPILEVNNVPLIIVKYMRKFARDFRFEVTRLHQDGELIYAIDFDNAGSKQKNSYLGSLYVDAATYAIVGMKMRQDKSGYPSGSFEYDGKQEPFHWNFAEFEAGFTKVDGEYRASYLLARDSFFIGERLASINYSFVYSASESVPASGSFPLVLDADLYYQLENSALSANTGFNALLPTAEEREFFNRK